MSAHSDAKPLDDRTVQAIARGIGALWETELVVEAARKALNVPGRHLQSAMLLLLQEQITQVRAMMIDVATVLSDPPVRGRASRRLLEESTELLGRSQSARTAARLVDPSPYVSAADAQEGRS